MINLYLLIKDKEGISIRINVMREGRLKEVCGKQVPANHLSLLDHTFPTFPTFPNLSPLFAKDSDGKSKNLHLCSSSNFQH